MSKRTTLGRPMRTRSPVASLAAPLIGPTVAIAAGLVVAALTGSRLLSLIALGVPIVLLASVGIEAFKRAMLGLAVLEIPIALDVYVGHDVTLAEWATPSGFNVSILSLALAVLYVIWVIEIATRRTVVRLSIARRLVPAFSYFSVVALSMIVAGDVTLSLYELTILGQAVLLFIYVVFNANSRADVSFLLLLLVGGILIQTVLGLATVVGPSTITFGPVTAALDDGRLAGTLGSANSFGGYLALTVPPALGLAIGGATRTERLIGGSAFALGGVLLVLSASRGAWVGTAVGIGLFLAVAWRLRWMTPGQRVVALVVPVVVVAVFWGAVFDRLASFNDKAALARFPLMRLAWAMIVDHPILGVGSNNFASSLGPYLTAEFAREWISTVHNKYLLVWAETGILGLATFLFLLGSTVKRAFRLVASSDAYYAPLALGLASGIVANMVHMFADIFNNRPHTQVLWLVLALVIALEYRFTTERREAVGSRPMRVDAPVNQR